VSKAASTIGDVERHLGKKHAGGFIGVHGYKADVLSVVKRPSFFGCKEETGATSGGISSGRVKESGDSTRIDA